MSERDNFEEQLLARLRGVVSERPAPGPQRGGGHRRSRLVLAGAAGAAGVVAVAVVAGSGGVTSSAYAVESNPDGTVSVAVSKLSDASGLQSSLREAGVPAVVDYSETETEAAEPGAPVCGGESEPGARTAPTVTVPLAEDDIEVTPAVPTEPAETEPTEPAETEPTEPAETEPGRETEPGTATDAPVEAASPVEAADAPSRASAAGAAAEPSFVIDKAKLRADEFVYIVASPQGDGKYLTVETIPAETGCLAGEPAVPATGE